MINCFIQSVFFEKYGSLQYSILIGVPGEMVLLKNYTKVCVTEEEMNRKELKQQETIYKEILRFEVI